MFKFLEFNRGMVLMKYNGDEEHIVVPDTHNGSCIFGIFSNAFQNCSMKSITLPETLVEINDQAFNGCKNLVEVTIPNSVINFGREIFSCCDNLKSINFPNNIKIIPEFFFANSQYLIEFEIPDSVITIEECAFTACRNLKKITIPEGVTNIEYGAFWNCEVLEEVTLPKSLKKLGSNAFSNCENLKKVIFLNENIIFNKSTFVNCDNIEYMTISAIKNLEINLQSKIVKGILLNKNSVSENDYKAVINHIKRKKDLKNQLFTQDNSQIISILIDEKINITIQQIEYYLECAIENNYNKITAILLEYKDKNISKEETAKLEMQKELIEIGLEYLTVKSFKENWFYRTIEGGIRVTGCKGENTVKMLPKQLENGTKIIALGKSKYSSYDKLKKFTIDAEITVIEPNTFMDCPNLKEINIPDTVTIIGEQAFMNCENLKEINIPDTVTKIGARAFMNCVNLKEITIPNSVTVIEPNTFMGCTNLVNVKLPENITEIQERAFLYCKNLEEINFPLTLKKIEYQAFLFCVNIKDILLSKTTIIKSDSFTKGKIINYSD